MTPVDRRNERVESFSGVMNGLASGSFIAAIVAPILDLNLDRHGLGFGRTVPPGLATCTGFHVLGQMASRCSLRTQDQWLTAIG